MGNWRQNYIRKNITKGRTVGVFKKTTSCKFFLQQRACVQIQQTSNNNYCQSMTSSFLYMILTIRKMDPNRRTID